MAAVRWDATQPTARLSLGPVEASLEVRNPSGGLSDLRRHSTPLAGWSLLEIELTGAQETPADMLDLSARGSELVATYSLAMPLMAEVCWRGYATDGGQGVELQVSLQTSQLEAHAQPRILGKVAMSEVFRLDKSNFDRWFSVAKAAGGTENWSRSEGPGCVLIRPANADFSYVEMIHPRDYNGTSLVADDQRCVAWQHDLDSRPLEKGVILRWLVRGEFVARENDTRTATDLYTSFLDAPPRLSR